jgi:hypothetical protein
MYGYTPDFNITLNSLTNKSILKLQHIFNISLLMLSGPKGSRTSDHILTLKTIIDKAFKSSKKVYACFIDFKKAFDTINREALFFNLK